VRQTFGCCACAANGHAAALLKSVMNSRRFMCSLKPRATSYHIVENRVVHYSNFGRQTSATGHKPRRRSRPGAGLCPHTSDRVAILCAAANGGQCQKGRSCTAAKNLFDHLVGELLEKHWHVETERLGGLEIDRHFELDRDLDGKLARFLTLEDAIDI
jgi:hypothetical protein